MSMPTGSLTGYTVIVGAGVHGAIFAASWNALSGETPVVLEKGTIAGGIFSRIVGITLNSANGASIDSVSSGPSRQPTRADHESLNYLPGSRFQIRSATEYPSSSEMSQVVSRTIREYSDPYYGCNVGIEYDGSLTINGEGYGRPARIIFAGGIAMKDSPAPSCNAIVTAEQFLRDPTNYEDRFSSPVCVIGAGDTGNTVVEYLLGQGLATPYTRPDSIHWYGGYGMAITKKQWTRNVHARYLGIARHMPQAGIERVIRPYQMPAEVVPMGQDVAGVRDRNFRLVILATGFKPVSLPNVVTDNYNVGGRVVAKKSYDTNVYAVGACADIGKLSPIGGSRFTAANDAIFNLAPRTAALAYQLYADR